VKITAELSAQSVKRVTEFTKILNLSPAHYSGNAQQMRLVNGMKKGG
jgi:hypothetical protein